MTEGFDLYAELGALLGALQAARVPHALCGALALAVHGIPRATRDIDLLVRPEDADRLLEVAAGLGYTLRALPMTLTSGLVVKRVTKIAGGRPLMLDLLLVHEPLESIWASRETVATAFGPIAVVSRDGLVTLKLTAGRPQDLADVERLRALEEDGHG